MAEEKKKKTDELNKESQVQQKNASDNSSAAKKSEKNDSKISDMQGEKDMSLEEIQEKISERKKKQKKEAKKSKKSKGKKGSGNNKNEKDFKPSNLEDLREKLDRKENRIFQKLITKRFAKNVSRGIIVKRLVLVSLIGILLTIVVLYALSYTYANSAGYGIDIIADRNYTQAISLSEQKEYNDASTVSLKATGIDLLDNTTYEWILEEAGELDTEEGGSHNGSNHIAYTFYVQNSGDIPLDYTGALQIKHSTRDVETAIRVQIFINGEATIYTHSYEEIGIGGGPGFDRVLENEGYAVEEFYSPDIVSSTTQNLDVAGYDRYTVVIWLEGNDVDCVNDKHSGELELAWKFTVVTPEG